MWAPSAAIIERGDLVRDVMVETMSRRFGDVPGLPSPAEWLTDNGSGYIARETRGFAQDIGLKPCRTPSRWYSVSADGLLEAARAVGEAASPIVKATINVIDLLKEVKN